MPGFVVQEQVQCVKCKGEGKVKTSTCHLCGGKNLKRGLDELYVFIEKGSPDGHEERFRDAADEFLNVRAGDIIFKVIEVEHPRFKREGDDLKLQVNITLK
jgi:DnaJ homolog subfamily A member 2